MTAPDLQFATAQSRIDDLERSAEGRRITADLRRARRPVWSRLRLRPAGHDKSPDGDA